MATIFAIIQFSFLFLPLSLFPFPQSSIHFSHRVSAYRKNYLAKVDWSACNCPLSRPRQEFLALWWKFWILQAVTFCSHWSVAGGERVSIVPQGCYFLSVRQYSNIQIYMQDIHTCVHTRVNIMSNLR